MKDRYYFFLGIAKMFERKKPSTDIAEQKSVEPKVFEIEDLIKIRPLINFRITEKETDRWLVARQELGEGPTGDGGGCFKTVETFYIRSCEGLRKLELNENDYFHVRLDKDKNIIYAKDTYLIKKIYLFAYT